MPPTWDALPKGWKEYWNDAHRSEDEIEAERKAKLKAEAIRMKKEQDERVKKAVEWVEKSNKSLETNLELELNSAEVAEKVKRYLERTKPQINIIDTAEFKEDPNAKGITIYDKDAVKMFMDENGRVRLYRRKDVEQHSEPKEGAEVNPEKPTLTFTDTVISNSLDVAPTDPMEHRMVSVPGIANTAPPPTATTEPVEEEDEEYDEDDDDDIDEEEEDNDNDVDAVDRGWQTNDTIKERWETYFLSKVIPDHMRDRIENVAKSSEYLIAVVDITTKTNRNKRYYYRPLSGVEYDILEGLMWNYHRALEADPDRKPNAVMAILRYIAQRMINMPLDEFMRADFNDLELVVYGVLYKLIYNV